MEDCFTNISEPSRAVLPIGVHWADATAGATMRSNRAKRLMRTSNGDPHTLTRLRQRHNDRMVIGRGFHYRRLSHDRERRDAIGEHLGNKRVVEAHVRIPCRKRVAGIVWIRVEAAPEIGVLR